MRAINSALTIEDSVVADNQTTAPGDQGGGGIPSCVVRFNRAGNANYNAAPEIAQTVTAQKANQTITFPALRDRRLGQSPVTAKATARA